jgi:acid phosphatase
MGALSSSILLVSFLAAIAGIISLHNSDALFPICEHLTARCNLGHDIWVSPHYPSWSAWFDPSLNHLHERSSPLKDDGWNLHYHLGGYGPWVEKLDGLVQGIEVPTGCRVDQVHMVGRQASAPLFGWIVFYFSYAIQYILMSD